MPKKEPSKKGSKEPMIEPFDLIEIYWADSCKQVRNWTPESEINYDAAVDFADGMRSVGYFLKVHRDHIFFAQEVDPQFSVGNVNSIPITSIRDLRVLKSRSSR